MKKTILILVFALISVISYSQITYKNLTIKEPTHYQDQVYNEVYVVVKNWAVPNGNDLKATIFVDVYKSKAISLTNPEWKLNINEVQNMQISFEFGDIINATTIAGGIKQALLATYPNWNAENIVIE